LISTPFLRNTERPRDETEENGWILSFRSEAWAFEEEEREREGEGEGEGEGDGENMEETRSLRRSLFITTNTFHF
jgi:hypothetical protein